MSEKISVVEEQAKRIKMPESMITEGQQYSVQLLDMCMSQQRTIEYLTDSEFRKFAFRLNYDRLITHYLENEGCIPRKHQGGYVPTARGCDNPPGDE